MDGTLVALAGGGLFMVAVAVVGALLAAALTADIDVQRSEGRQKAYLVKASTTIYKGALVGVDANGYLVEMAHGTAGLIFVGVATEQVVQDASSAYKCRVAKVGEYEYTHNAGGQAQANIGDTVCAFDGGSVDLAAATTNDYNVGDIVEVVSATKVRIRIDNYTK